MTATVHATLVDTLDYLTLLAQDGARPEEAQARLRDLREQHPDADLELVWEEEAYDQFIHYDALLSLPGEGTVSLSFAPDRALPWPLRGVYRWSDQELVRVNATVMKVEHAIACLDFIWEKAPVIDRLLHACLIQEELARNPIELSGVELQAAVDGFRRARRLYTAEDTHRWMARRGITHEKLEAYAGDEAIIARLRERVAAGRVDEYFAAHRSDFDRACIVQVVFPDEEEALSAYEHICRGAMSLLDVAQQRAIASLGQAEQRSYETFAVLRRGKAPAAMTMLFDTRSGDALPPVRTDDGFILAQVLAVVSARLDDPTRLEIQRILFGEWLDERRQAATIEWNWGNAQRTAAVARSEPVTPSTVEGDR